MTDELIAYLMEDLSPERRAEVERRLQTDATWQQELKRIEECLAETGDPNKCAEVEEPPSDLLMRTCFLVEQAGDCGRGEIEPAGLSTAQRLTPMSAGAAIAGRRRRLSITDVTVGSGALVLLGCLIAPALLETRESTRGLVCQDNLRWLGNQLFDYQERMPNHELPPVLPGEHAGMFAVRLAKQGVDRQELTEHLVCPNTVKAEQVFAGRCQWTVPTEEQVEQAQGLARIQLVKSPWGTYAIRLGHFDAEDYYHLPQYAGGDEPLLADEPDLSRQGWASSNHRGGQHVLYENLSVKFRTNCTLAGGHDNMFRNEAGDHAAPCDPKDKVLSRWDHGPWGRVGLLYFGW